MGYPGHSKLGVLSSAIWVVQTLIRFTCVKIQVSWSKLYYVASHAPRSMGHSLDQVLCVIGLTTCPNIDMISYFDASGKMTTLPRISC